MDFLYVIFIPLPILGLILGFSIRTLMGAWKAKKIGDVYCCRCGEIRKVSNSSFFGPLKFFCAVCGSADWKQIEGGSLAELRGLPARTFEGMQYSPSSNSIQDDATKKCPACAETIKLEAKKCRFCHEVFDPVEVEKEIEAYRSRKAELERQETEKKKVGAKQCPTCGNWDVYTAADGEGGSCDWCPHCKEPIRQTKIEQTGSKSTQICREDAAQTVEGSQSTTIIDAALTRVKGSASVEPHIKCSNCGLLRKSTDTWTDLCPKCRSALSGQESVEFEALETDVDGKNLPNSIRITPDGCCEICPKCGYERKAGDDAFVAKTECPKCRVIYVKFLESQREIGSIQKQSNERTREQHPSKMVPNILSGRIREKKRLCAALGIILLLACTVLLLGKVSSTPDSPFTASLFEKDIFLIRSNGRYGYMDKSGKVVISPQYDMANAFSEGLAAVKIGDLWGVIDQEGQLVISPRYQSAGSFVEGLAPVKSGERWGYINSEARTVIKFKFDEASKFYNGLAFVKVKDKWGWVNTSGDVIVAPQYDDIRVPNDGMVPVKIHGKWGYADGKGRMIISPRFDHVNRSFYEGLSCASINGKYGFINKTGEFVIQPQFESCSRFQEGLAPILEDKAGFIDNTGRFVIGKQYQGVWLFSEGRAPIKLNYHWGYINKMGEITIKPIFDNAHEFSRGLAKVATNSCISNETTQPDKDDHDPKWRWSYIDTTGNVVWTEDTYFVPKDYIFESYWSNVMDKASNQKDKLAVCYDGFEYNIAVLETLLTLQDYDINNMTVPELYKTASLLSMYCHCITMNEAAMLLRMQLSSDTISKAKEVRDDALRLTDSIIITLQHRGYLFKDFKLGKLQTVDVEGIELKSSGNAKRDIHRSKIVKGSGLLPEQKNSYRSNDSSFSEQRYGHWVTRNDSDSPTFTCKTDYTPEWKWHNMTVPDYPNVRIALICFEHECGATWKGMEARVSNGEVTVTGEILRDQDFSHVDILVNDRWDGVSKELHGIMFQLQDGKVKIDTRDSTRLTCLKDDGGAFGVNRKNTWYPFELKYRPNGNHEFKVQSNGIWHSLRL